MSDLINPEELRSFTHNNGRVIIYGAGFTAKKTYKWLKSNHIDIDSFWVTDSTSNESEIEGIPVLQFDEAKINYNHIKVIVAIKWPWNEEVKERLKKYNIDIYDVEDESFDKKNKHIEITTQIECSVNCRYCPQKLFVSSYDSHINKLTLEAFKRIIDKLPEDFDIVFSGFSEPFLNEEACDMMIYASECGRNMYLNTTLIGLTREKFEAIKKLNFKRNILHLPDNNNNSNIPITNEYLDLLDFVLDGKKEQNGVQTAWLDSGNCQGEVAYELTDIIRGRLHVYSALHDRAGNLSAPGDICRSADHLKGKICCYASPHLHNHVLLPDGRLVLCCMDFGLRHIIGNLLEQEYDDIQNGKIMKEIREAMNNSEGDILCRSCTEAKSICNN